MAARSPLNTPAERGHLLEPMYQPVPSDRAGTVKERRVTCTHRGEPVPETVFVMQHCVLRDV